MPRQCHARPGHLLARHVQRAFNRLGITEQALALGQAQAKSGYAEYIVDIANRALARRQK